MSVTTLRPKRPRLAELHRQAEALAAQVASLTPSQSERERALLELPTALEAHRQALQDHDLDGGDGAALQAARQRVLDLRATIADKPDQTSQLGRLRAEQVQIGQSIAAAAEDAVLGELDKLIGQFQHHAKAAQVAAAAINGLREGAINQGRQRIAEATTDALELSRDPAEAALRKAALDQVLASVRSAWASWPAILAADPEAQPAPLSDAVAMLPTRPEEQGEAANVAA